MNLCIIPARGGSKRIPNKNIKMFYGLPMIAWSIKAALESKCFSEVVVSTDSDEIAEIARKHKAIVPFKRPDDISDDTSGTLPVVIHAINDFIARNKVTPTYTCCLYATAPFVTSADIVKTRNLLCENNSDFVLPIAKFDSPIQRALMIKPGGKVGMVDDNFFDVRSQDLPDRFHDAGQFYWGKSNAWLNEKPPFLADSVPYLLSKERVQDIDTLDDWVFAEKLFQLIHENP